MLRVLPIGHGRICIYVLLVMYHCLHLSVRWCSSTHTSFNTFQAFFFNNVTSNSLPVSKVAGGAGCNCRGRRSMFIGHLGKIAQPRLHVYIRLSTFFWIDDITNVQHFFCSMGFRPLFTVFWASFEPHVDCSCIYSISTLWPPRNDLALCLNICYAYNNICFFSVPFFLGLMSNGSTARTYESDCTQTAVYPLTLVL